MDDADDTTPPVAMSAHDTFSLAFHTSCKVIQKDGGKRPAREVWAGDDYWHDGERWVHKYRLIDRRRDVYAEFVMVMETGRLLRRKLEPLSEHTGRGGARKETD